MLHVHRCRVSNLDGIYLDLCLRVFVFSTIIARFESDVKAKFETVTVYDVDLFSPTL